MAYNKIAQAIISLRSSGIEGLSFGIPLFLTAHARTLNYVDNFSSVDSVSQTLGIESNAYKAALNTFAPTPNAGRLKIGKIAPDSVTFTIPSGNLFFSGSFSYVDSVSGDVVFANIDSGSQPSSAAVAENVSSAIGNLTNLDPAITVDYTVGEEFFTINLGKQNVFAYQGGTVDETYTVTETADEAYSRVLGRDKDFFFVTAETRDPLEVVDLADAVGASSKMMFTADDTQGSLSGSGPFGFLSNNDLSVLFHQDASVDFPELTFASYNAIFPPGSVTWSNLRVPLTASQDASGSFLTDTQKDALDNNNIAYVDNVAGIPVLRNGVTTGGEAIETIRGRYAMTNDLEVALTNLFINQQGGKVPYTNGGISQIYSTVQSVLDLYVGRGFIRDDYVMNFLPANRVPLADKQNNIYQSGSFTANLTGAILETSVQGVLQLSL